ncbi:MAG: carboxypeptidase-like regulatory domain-containing protein, partial [Terriglobia bacterium]
MFLRNERILLKVVLGTSVLFLALAFSMVLAQVNTADLHGTITDPSGAVIANAEIKIQTLDTGLVRATRTKENGTFTFLALTPGRYSLQVSATGFQLTVVREITLTVGQQAELSLRLQVSPVLKAIEVLADTKLLEARRASITTTVAQRYIE